MRVKYSGFLSSSFQRVLLDVLNSPGLTWFPSPDGSSLTRSALTAGVASVVFYGSDLFRADDGSVSGTVKGFELTSAGGDSVGATGTNANFDLAQLVDAAASVTDGFGSPEYLGFLDVLMRPNNHIVGTSHRNVLESGPGNDTLAGRAGNDVFVLHPDASSSTAAAAEEPKVDVVRGGSGHRDALLIEHPDGARVALMDGSAKYTILLSNGAIAGRVHDNDDPFADIAMVRGVEDVRGSRANEFIVGNRVDNRLFGRGGDDFLQGKGGKDHLSGGSGRDTLYGGIGDDTLKGGTGADTLGGDSGADVLLGNKGADILDGGIGNDTMTGGDGRDVFVFHAHVLAAEQGHDIITDFDAAHDSIRFVNGSHTDIEVSLSNGDTVIEYGNGVITLMGVQLAEGDIMFQF